MFVNDAVPKDRYPTGKVYAHDIDGVRASYFEAPGLGTWLAHITKGGIKKMASNVGAAVAGAVTLGLVPPKVFNIKGHSAMQDFRIGRDIGIATAAVVGASVLAPVLFGGAAAAPAAAAGVGAGTVTGVTGGVGTFALGALKFVGGTLVSPMSKALIGQLTGMGVNPADATQQQLIHAGVLAGDISTQDLNNAADNIRANAAGASISPNLHASMFGGGSTILMIGGFGALALLGWMGAKRRR